MLKAYFDKSGQESAKFLTLSGIAAPDDVWVEIEQNWKHILLAGDLKAAYMHMVEAVGLRDEFSPGKGWTREKVFPVINALLSYVTTIPKERYCQFACTIDMDAYRKLRAETYQMESPVELCIILCVDRVVFWYLHEYKDMDLEAIYCFDQNEPFEPIFKAKWEREIERDLWIKTYSIWQHIKDVGSADMRVTVGLQVADMLAWGGE